MPRFLTHAVAVELQHTPVLFEMLRDSLEVFFQISHWHKSAVHPKHLGSRIFSQCRWVQPHQGDRCCRSPTSAHWQLWLLVDGGAPFSGGFSVPCPVDGKILQDKEGSAEPPSWLSKLCRRVQKCLSLSSMCTPVFL